jgi:hypothetical protein
MHIISVRVSVKKIQSGPYDLLPFFGAHMIADVLVISRSPTQKNMHIISVRVSVKKMQSGLYDLLPFFGAHMITDMLVISCSPTQKIVAIKIIPVAWLFVLS